MEIPVWQIVGQKRVVSFLQRSLKNKSLAHAYLLVGPPHVGKMTLAITLAQALNCPANEPPCGECVSCHKVASLNHPDVQVVGLLVKDDSSEAKLISTDQVEQMQHSASLPPFEGNYKVFIVDGAELLSVEAANRLLKTLEEPVGKVIFILLTTNENLLLSTVISRCQRLELVPLPAVEIESALVGRWRMEPEKARLLSRLSHGCIGWALAAVSDDSLLLKRKEALERLETLIKAGNEERFVYVERLAAQFTQNRALVYQELDFWLDYWRDLMLVKTECSDIIINVDRLDALKALAEGYRLRQIKAFIESIRAAGEQLYRNASPRLVLEVLMLDLPEKETLAR